ncbi:MAG: nucleotidyltransferase family protein [Phenylobacterium sp.]|nr:nucleotidyltransferase family protein [Phenylobacterium sp.]MDP3175409.1 nucleotidyltransferase family protein [Phenylobacterium sp.]
MVLAAGVGSRMRPLTDTQPKALVQVAGKPLIDHVLDRLADAGVERAVVNVHHFAEQLEAHLAARSRPSVQISDERAGLLDSGGGIHRARALLGDDPIWVANIDSLWIDEGLPPLEAMKAAWDPEVMDCLLLLVQRGRGIGFEGPEGFWRDADGRLVHSRDPLKPTPFANVGFQILKPQILEMETDAAFSILPTWRRLSAQGRLFGVPMEAFWMHVGDLAAQEAAEARLR